MTRSIEMNLTFTDKENYNQKYLYKKTQKMRKSLLTLTLICTFLLMAWNKDSLFAQPISVTVPDYAYGMVHSEYGTVTQSGVANPGAYGGYSVQESCPGYGGCVGIPGWSNQLLVCLDRIER